MSGLSVAKKLRVSWYGVVASSIKGSSRPNLARSSLFSDFKSDDSDSNTSNRFNFASTTGERGSMFRICVQGLVGPKCMSFFLFYFNLQWFSRCSLCGRAKERQNPSDGAGFCCSGLLGLT